MITESTTITITATFNEERTHRYKLCREWSNEKTNKTATIIMSHASSADILRSDLTSMLVQNNLINLGFKSVNMVNLFSCICHQKLDLSGDISTFTNEENLQTILQCVQDTDVTIIAIGSLATTYKKVEAYQQRLFDLLRKQNCLDKIHVITAPDGTEGLHPLSAKLRASGSWTLTKYTLPDPPPIETTEVKTGKGKAGKKNDKPNDNKVIPIAPTD